MTDFPRNILGVEELLGMPYNDELRLTVQDCSSTSFSEAYVSQNLMTEHVIWYGDSKVLLTENGLKTACNFLRDPSTETPDAVSDYTIQINSAIREKLGVSVGDEITILINEHIPHGNTVCCVPVTECLKDLENVNFFEAFLRPHFKDAFRPVHEGDVFSVTRGSEKIQFKITNIDPSPFCIVGPGTIIKCKLGSEELNNVESEKVFYPTNKPKPEIAVTKVDPAPILGTVAKLPIKSLAIVKRVNNETAENELDQNNRHIDSCQAEDTSDELTRKNRETLAQANTKSNRSKFPRLIDSSSQQSSTQFNPHAIELVTEKPFLKSESWRSNLSLVRVDPSSPDYATLTTPAISFASLENSKPQTKENNSLVALELPLTSSLKVDHMKGQITATEKKQLLTSEKEANYLCWIHNLIVKYKDCLGTRYSLDVKDWMGNFRKLKIQSSTPEALKNNSEDLQRKLWESPLLQRIDGLLETKRRFEEAIELNKNIHERQQLLLGCDNVKSVSTLFRIAHLTLQIRPRGFVNALPLFNKVFEKRSTILGPDNNETLMARYYIACCLVDDRKINDAMIILENVFAKQKKLIECDQKEIADTEFQIARCLHLQRKYEEAKAMYIIVYDKRKQRLGFSHPDTLDVQFNIGLVDRCQRKFQEALATFEAFLPLSVKYLGSQNSRTVDAKKEIQTLKAFFADCRKEVTKHHVNLNEPQKSENKNAVLTNDNTGISNSTREYTKIAQNIEIIQGQGASRISQCRICLRLKRTSNIRHIQRECPFYLKNLTLQKNNKKYRNRNSGN